MKKLLHSVVSMVPLMVLALLIWGVASVLAAEQKNNMELVGTNDLQARSTYQPTVHRYPGDRYILFGGEHPLPGTAALRWSACVTVARCRSETPKSICSGASPALRTRSGT